jgi:hypothetical protein
MMISSTKTRKKKNPMSMLKMDITMPKVGSSHERADSQLLRKRIPKKPSMNSE